MIENNLFFLSVAGGSLIGAIAGGASKWFYQSLNVRNLWKCTAFNYLPIVGSFNKWREWQFKIVTASPLISMAAIGLLGLAKKDLTQILILLPLFLAFHAADLIRSQLETFPFIRQHVDISGHALNHCMFLALQMEGLNAISKWGTKEQLRNITLLVGALSLTEVPWVYNTVANCHSIADILVGCALPILSSFTIHKAKNFAYTIAERIKPF